MKLVKSILLLLAKIYLWLINLIFNLFMNIFKTLKKKNPSSKKILILTNDHIGDTVVRIEYLKKYIEYYGKDNVYFLVSNVGKPIVGLLTDNLIIYDKKKLYWKLPYKISFLKEINKYEFTTIISLVYSNFSDAELIVRMSADVKSVSYSKDSGDCNYVLNYLTEQFNDITNSNYSNDDFRPHLEKYLNDSSIKKYSLPKEYITLGMGAFAKLRVYPAEKFAEVLRFLKMQNLNIVFLGNGAIDEQFFEEVNNYEDCTKDNIINLIGKTSMVDTIHIIKNSKLFIGVESGLWNCSYALNIPSVVVYGGGHYGRFMHKTDNIRYAYSYMDCFQCSWNCGLNKDINSTAECISKIKPENIINSIKELGICEEIR